MPSVCLDLQHFTGNDDLYSPCGVDDFHFRSSLSHSNKREKKNEINIFTMFFASDTIILFICYMLSTTIDMSVRLNVRLACMQNIRCSNIGRYQT